ncbi:hypothetical protein C8A05DRAFT_46537 [Staphylotrichum tortipilum]|uniref:Uncharacterized protein n=1 Tax=Staphylotrichum tortipilum TaxID=2831512 RepID=A0AAN6MFR5_9PEZI|nr:hypothetical protein C8A05DRAFT_46537 [Staphylotrichum longicolle]
MQKAAGSVYFYAPNRGAAIFFTAAFAASGLVHLGQCKSYQFFKVTALLPICCAFATAAFATRAYSSSHTDDAPVYTASMLLLYIFPPILALANSLILGRLFSFVPYFAPMHPSRMLVTFASLTGVIELVTIAGIAYLTNRDLSDKLLLIGNTLTKASLVLPLLVITVIFVLAGIFHRCCRAGKIKAPQVTRPLLVLYASMLLILGRTLFRTVEQFRGSAWINRGDGSLPLTPAVRYEWYFYVFDAAPMLIVSVLWNIWHPGRFLPRDRRAYLAQDGVTVLMGPGWKDSRSLTETFFNPFAMLTTRGGHQKQFWESNGYALRSTGRRNRRT